MGPAGRERPRCGLFFSSFPLPSGERVRVRGETVLDIRLIREETAAVEGALKARGETLSVRPILELDQRRRQLVREAEDLKAERNRASEVIGQAKRRGESSDAAMARMREVGERIKALDGQIKQAAQIAKSRFVVMWGAAVRLSRALAQFMLDLHTKEHGFTEVWVPHLVNAETMTGVGMLPKFEEQMFKTVEPEADRTLYLIPTAEVSLTALHGGEILAEATLPKRYCALTPCYRREAGTYGQDTKGMIRVHQFDKVEMVKVTTPAQSYEELESMVRSAEAVLQRLELPYRVVTLCTADMGFHSAKTYDLEVWLPGQRKYREISSCSNCEAFQARRLDLKYRPAGGGTVDYCHTLNGSGLAVGRTLIAVLENYQEADGSVSIPKALQAYMGGQERITPVTK